MAIVGMSVRSAAGRLAAKLTQWVLPVGIIVLWEMLSVAGVIPAHVLPAPSSVVAAGWRLTLSGELPWNVWVSFCRAMRGLTRISMQQLIERVWLKQGFTAIMVTHDVAEAVALADRILLIEDGKIGLDQRLDLPRPRDRGLPEVAAMERRILRELFQKRGAVEPE